MPWFFGQPPAPEMVDAEHALTGGDAPVLTNPEPHTVLGTPITGAWRQGQRTVYVALGCFWGAEKLLWQLPGVESTSVGFAGGFTKNPTYREVCTGRTGHTETVEVVYDPERISLEQILTAALEAHDPTQGYRQGADVGTQYRSAIYTAGERALHDAQLARELTERYGERLREHGYGDITTEILPLAQTPAGAYFRAEKEHQQYLDKNPGGYCPVHSTGVACG